MRRFLQPTTALLAALAVCAVLFGLGYAWRDLGQSAASAQQPATTGAPAATVPAPAKAADPAPVPTPLDALQAAYTAALTAKAKIDKATTDKAKAEKDLADGTTEYATAYAKWQELAGQTLPPPKPVPLPPINPDSVSGDQLIIVHNGGTVRPWEAAEATAAIKASGLTAYAYDATSLTLDTVQKAWVAHAKADGLLPWIGVLAGSKIVYRGKADDGRLLDVVKSFAKKAAEPEPAIVAPATGYQEATTCPTGCTNCKGGKR